MSRGLNKVQLIGHLGRDPEITYTPNGLAVGRFSLATTEGRKNAEGEWQDHTEWHRIVTFGKTAETVSQYLTKGKQVYIEGRLQTRSWEKEGQTHWSTEIIANQLLMLGRKDDTGGSSQKQERYEPQPEQYTPPPDDGNGDEEEDLPF